jgi:hypothetical protein
MNGSVQHYISQARTKKRTSSTPPAHDPSPVPVALSATQRIRRLASYCSSTAISRSANSMYNCAFRVSDIVSTSPQRCLTEGLKRTYATTAASKQFVNIIVFRFTFGFDIFFSCCFFPVLDKVLGFPSPCGFGCARHRFVGEKTLRGGEKVVGWWRVHPSNVAGRLSDRLTSVVTWLI